MRSQDYNINVRGYELIKDSFLKMIELGKEYPQKQNEIETIAKLSKELIQEELMY